MPHRANLMKTWLATSENIIFKYSIELRPLIYSAYIFFYMCAIPCSVYIPHAVGIAKCISARVQLCITHKSVLGSG